MRAQGRSTVGAAERGRLMAEGKDRDLGGRETSGQGGGKRTVFPELVRLRGWEPPGTAIARR